MFSKLCKWAALTIVLAVFTMPSFALAKKETHEFTLYQGKGIRDPYFQEYEITLEREGLVHVRVNVTAADRKMKKPLLIGIANKQKRKLRTTVQYRSKDRGAVLRHAVDSPELRIGRTYLVYIGNYSSKRMAKGTIIIDYPAGPEKPKQTATPPDLAVTRIWLNKECRVQVAVTNPGPVNLSPAHYQKNIPTLYLFRNGKPWGGAALNLVDPSRKLVKKGGRAVYTSNLKVTGTEQIQAFIDYRNVLKEKNEKNNRKTAKLTCKPPPPVVTPLKPATVQAVPMDKPDLVVQSVRLTGDCRVMVTIANSGPGTLPDSAWNQKTSPTLILYRNGKRWGGANLTVIDPKRRLQRNGGRARYISNLKVAGKMNIQAVVDYHGILDEKDEINNAKAAKLQCQ